MEQCKAHSWSLKSTNKLLSKLKSDPFFVGHVMVEAAVISCHMELVVAPP